MYKADPKRYENMQYLRCGNSGILMPRLALGLWHNFGSSDSLENQKALLFQAFDLGITHFDLANNYGPIPGSAEENFGRILKSELSHYRDELLISTKAGYSMWEGPYGDWGSRKYLMSSLDQSLKRMGLEYVDIFYHHRPDPNTPIEETMGALSDIVKKGKALYVGISNYNSKQAKEAIGILKENGTPCLIHQPQYNMFNRWVEEDGLLDVLEENGVGSIVFCPLAQGLLTDRYLKGIPEDSRAKSTVSNFLRVDSVTTDNVDKASKLNSIAQDRGQSLAQMALAWVLRGNRVTTALIGASKVSQIRDNVAALKNLEFSADELSAIDQILNN